MQEERRLAAIMFSDICGFSRIMGENEERAIAFASMHKDCIQSGTEIHGGRIIKEMGDGMLVEFASAVNAVRCAIAVQKAVYNYNSTAEPEEQFHIRIGIHVGDVVVSDGDILGDGVNVASRIEPLAEPGGICISRDIFDLVRNKISIETVHLGAHELKNISQQISIYKILLDAVGPVPGKPKNGNSRKPLYIAASIAGIILLALLLKGANQNRQAQQQTAEPSQAEQTASREDVVKQRHVHFVKAVMTGKKEEALSFVPPPALKQGDPNKIWNGLVFISAFMRLGKVTAEDIKIKYVHVSESGREADVIMQIRKKSPGTSEETWQDTKPMKWVYIDNNWYIDIKSEQQKTPGRKNIDHRRTPERTPRFQRRD